MNPYLGGQDLVTSWGLGVLLALAICWSLARRNAKKAGIDPSHVDLLLPLAVLAGIVGSVVITRAFPADRVIAGSSWIAAGRSRVIPYVLAGIGAVFVYARFTEQSGRRLLDVLALPALVGLVVQRFGCLLAGCCWGDVAVQSERLADIASTDLGRQLMTLSWAGGDWWGPTVAYPAGSFAWEQHVAAGLIGPGAEISLAVHPTQIYEAVLFALLAAVLWRSRIGRQVPGGVALACVLGYAPLGFATEFLRADSPVVFGPLTITQLQCVAVLVAGLAVWRLTPPMVSLRVGVEAGRG